MKRALFGIMGLVAVTMPAPVRGDPVNCDYLVSMNPDIYVLQLFEPDAVACIGAFDGNNDGYGENDVLGQIAGAGWGTATQVADGQWDGDQSKGTIYFNPSLTGDYVLALKSSHYYSLYRFEGLNDVKSIYYTTLGTAINSNTGRGKGLSHYTLYSTRTVTVPEPESAALLLTGLVGLGFVATRRRRDNIA